MTPPDPARIAAGLTSDMRDVLMRFEDGSDAVRPGSRDNLNAWIATAMHVPWLIRTQHNASIWHLTDLGRAVRAALAAGSRGDTANPDDGDVR